MNSNKRGLISDIVGFIMAIVYALINFCENKKKEKGNE